MLEGELPGPYERVPAAADSGNGISAILDYKRDLFVNSDLTINLLRRPVGEWICVDAQTWLGSQGRGLAESRLFDFTGLVGRASQSRASAWVESRTSRLHRRRLAPIFNFF